MNKIITAVFFLFLLTQVTLANEIKAMIGMNWSKYLFSSEAKSLECQQKTGFGVGVGWTLDLNKNIKFEINLLYSQKGAKVTLPFATDKNISGIYENSTIASPLFLKYKFKDQASPYAALGPEFIFIVAHQFRIPESEDDFNLLENTKKFVLAINALLGYEWPMGQWGLFSEIRYSRWLSNFLVDPEARAKSESFTFLIGGMYYL